MIRRIALLSVHAGPLIAVGSGKAGGMNVYVREVARELGRQGIAVDVYTAGLRGEVAVDFSLGEGVRLISVPLDFDDFPAPAEYFPYLDQFVQGVLSAADRFEADYDLIFSHYWLSGWVAHRLREVWSVPFVQMFHTLGSMKDRVVPSESDQGQSGESVLRFGVEEKIARQADRIIAATPAEYAQLLWLYRTDRERIQIVPPGVDLDRFYPEPFIYDVRARLGLPEQRYVLLFAGRLEPLKGVEVVLDSLCVLRNGYPEFASNLVFVVVGGGEGSLEAQRLSVLVEKLDLGDMVRFVGALDQDVLADLYRIALAVVVPSDYESFGMVALEAMACGALVIASGVGGLAYLIKDGEAGWLFPARDSVALAGRVVELMENPEIRRQLGVVAGHVAERYSWAQIVFRLRAVFQGLVSEGLASV